jgi:hypothetical protein
MAATEKQATLKSQTNRPLSTGRKNEAAIPRKDA